MKTLLATVAAVALMTGAAMAQTVTFNGANDRPIVGVTEGNSIGRANAFNEDERTRARHTNDQGSTNLQNSAYATGNDGTHSGTLSLPDFGPGNSEATLQLGTGNAAGTIQYGSNNEAATLQIGHDNRSLLLQNGNGGSSGGGLNEAAVVQVGNDNVNIGLQRGNDNALSVLQEGDGNKAATIQDNDDDVAATVQFGDNNVSFISQGNAFNGTYAGVAGSSVTAPGFVTASSGGAGTGNNAAVAVQIGETNQSSIFQHGQNNGAFALQVEN